MNCLSYGTILIIVVTATSLQAQDNIVENAYEHLSFRSPIDFQLAPGVADTVFVVERAGTIQRFRNHPQTDETTQVLDIRSKVSTQSEGGLLGVAFHPEFAQNGELYVYYTAPDSDPNIPLRSIFARFETDPDNPEIFDPDSEFILFELDQTRANHNGGQILFGPDGYLYIALGDGGGSGDPDENGQDRTTLHGNILRIDIDNIYGDLNYAIPDDNPFAGNTEGWREEIYAWGFRNPFRFSFDTETGELWVADVGQHDREEVNIVESGKNYGWNIMEGNNCYSPSTGCDTTGLELPVHEYGFDGGQSITGGFVYRGEAAPSQHGRYFYGDYVTGDLWSFDYDGEEAIDNQSFGMVGGRELVCFGEDHDGELYMCLMGEGRVYRIIIQDDVDTSTGPEPDWADRPQSPQLKQNYPNPFNPRTTITFYLPEEQDLILAVYDLLGRRIMTLTDGVHSAGAHTIPVDISGLPSGVYTYRLEVADLTLTRNMTLIK